MRSERECSEGCLDLDACMCKTEAWQGRKSMCQEIKSATAGHPRWSPAVWDASREKGEPSRGEKIWREVERKGTSLARCLFLSPHDPKRRGSNLAPLQDIPFFHACDPNAETSREVLRGISAHEHEEKWRATCESLTPHFLSPCWLSCLQTFIFLLNCSLCQKDCSPLF